MPLNTQTRSPINLTVQQHANKPAATLLCDQAVLVDSDYTQSVEKDLIRVDSSGGNVDITLLPGVQQYAFKPYKVQKIDAANTVTIAADAGDTNGIEGSASISLTGENEIAIIYWDPDFQVWRRAQPGGSAAGVAGALLIANNLSDLANPATARTNLGGTTVGKAVFTAASAAAARTAIGSTVIGDAIFIAANAAAVYTALGLGNYADDAAAAGGGVAVGACYHTAGVLKTRMV